MIHDNMASIFYKKSDFEESLVFMLKLHEMLPAVMYFLNIDDRRVKTIAIMM